MPNHRVSLRKKRSNFTGDDAREGLTCVLSVKVPDPKFSSQTKDKLVSSEVRPVVESLVGDKLAEWFEENPAKPKQLWPRLSKQLHAREAARKARELTRRKTAMDVEFPRRQARGLLRRATQQNQSCSSSKGTPPAVLPRQGATAAHRLFCRLRARSSTWSARALTGCLAARRSVTL